MGTIWTQIEKRTTVGILNQLTTFTRSMITHLPACKLPVPFQGCVTRKLSPSPSMSRGQPCRASRTGPGFVPASCSYVQIVHKLPVVAGYCSVATRPATLPSYHCTSGDACGNATGISSCFFATACATFALQAMGLPLQAGLELL